MRAKSALRTGGVGLAAITAVAAGYPLLLRQRCLTWGAEPDEIDAVMPGDELLRGAPLVTTRAVTIEAPPKAVWPWLVQMGPGRAGAYTYDWIENLLGLNMHSADRIRPELQDLKIGDSFAMGKGPKLRVEILDPEAAMVLRSEDGVWVWAFGLHPRTDAGDTTRLVSRNRIAASSSGHAARLFFRYVMEPGSLVMERKMLLGIKERVEGLR